MRERSIISPPSVTALRTTNCVDESSPIGKILIAFRLAGHAAIRERFERAGARPVQVVETHHQTAGAGEPLEQAADRAVHDIAVGRRRGHDQEVGERGHGHGQRGELVAGQAAQPHPSGRAVSVS